MHSNPVKVLRILLLTERYFPLIGGGEFHVHYLAKYLKSKGHAVTILTRNLTPHSGSVSTPDDQGIEVIRLGKMAPFENTFARFRFLVDATLYMLKNDERWDIIHAHAYLAGFPAIAMKRMRDTPVIFTVHGHIGKSWGDMSGSWPEAIVKRRIEEYLLFYEYDGHISVNPAFFKYFQSRHKRGGTRYIPNGIEIAVIDGIAPSRKEKGGAILVTYIGRLDKLKGVDYMIESMQYLTDLDVRIQIIGDGAYRESLRRLSSDMGVSDQISFMGDCAHDRAISILKGSDIFILPSLSEGMPMTLLEAWAAKVPAIVTSVGAIPLICADNDDSVIIPPKDPKAIADAVRRIASSKALVERIAYNGRVKVESDYSIEAMGKQTEMFYNEFLN